MLRLWDALVATVKSAEFKRIKFQKAFVRKVVDCIEDQEGFFAAVYAILKAVFIALCVLRLLERTWIRPE